MLFSFSFLFFSVIAAAQVVVDGVNINELEEVKICQVVASGRMFSNKVVITIDYGQQIRWASTKGSQVKDKDGKLKVFNSVIAVLNHMENNGWAYIDAQVVTIPGGMGGNQNVYHYLFRKKDTDNQ